MKMSKFQNTHIKNSKLITCDQYMLLGGRKFLDFKEKQYIINKFKFHD